MKQAKNLELKIRIFNFMKDLRGSKKSILEATYASLEDVMFTKAGRMNYKVGTLRLYEIVNDTYELLFER